MKVEFEWKKDFSTLVSEKTGGLDGLLFLANYMSIQLLKKVRLLMERVFSGLALVWQKSLLIGR